jgi:hypothetical protein
VPAASVLKIPSRIGFVRQMDNGSWNYVDTTMAHSGYAQTREGAGQLLRRRFERMVREGAIWQPGLCA